MPETWKYLGGHEGRSACPTVFLVYLGGVKSGMHESGTFESIPIRVRSAWSRLLRQGEAAAHCFKPPVPLSRPAPETRVMGRRV